MLTVPSLSEIIANYDIIRTDLPAHAERVPLYQSNGRIGCVWGPWGLHCLPDAPYQLPIFRPTQNAIYDIRYFGRGTGGKDYLLPCLQISWQTDFDRHVVTEYRQHQSLYHGTVSTEFSYPGGKVSLTTWFDPVERNTMGMELDIDGDCPPIRISPMASIEIHYDQRPPHTWQLGAKDGLPWLKTACLDGNCEAVIRTDMPVEIQQDAIVLYPHPGRQTITIGMNGLPLPADISLAQTQQWWHDAWQRSAWIDVPEMSVMTMYYRSLAYLLMSVNDDGLGMPPPHALSGSCVWGFPFTNDLGLLFPALLASGLLPIARAWVEYFSRNRDGMKAYTRHWYGIDGIIAPINFPFGSWENFHQPTPPNHMVFGLYHGRYLTRMAYETGMMVNDPCWFAQHARPLIHEVAKGYAAICHREDDGYWHIHVKPSWGQDSYAKVQNQKDYLDGLQSAAYVLSIACRLGLDDDGSMQAILHDGLAFPTLLQPNGVYATDAEAGRQAYGNEKHPVQLATLFDTPLSTTLDDPTLSAYQQRLQLLAKGAENGYFVGWTAPALLVSGSHLAAVEEWTHDWRLLQTAPNLDPERITFYETAGRHRQPFFVTNHGIMVYALLENFVSSWWGDLRLANIVPWKTARFGNIHTPVGVCVSGVISEEAIEVELIASRDVTVTVRGEQCRLVAGEHQLRRYRRQLT
jgi:hypothetical protein